MSGLRLFNWSSGPDILEGLDSVVRELENSCCFQRERGEKGYNLSLEIPGVKKEDLSLEIKGRVLLVNTKDRFSEERRYSEHLPEDAEGEAAEARLEDGVLYIRVPFKEAAGGRKIPVK
jgi:HSP20 family molecular chaperone IbpA